jgi:nitric oxide reductase large subunit
MPSTPAISGAVTITALSIKGDSVTDVFTSVIGLFFDYYKGMVRITDSVQGEFYYGITRVTAITFVIAGTTHSVTIS